MSCDNTFQRKRECLQRWLVLEVPSKRSWVLWSTLRIKLCCTFKTRQAGLGLARARAARASRFVSARKPRDVFWQGRPISDEPNGFSR